METLGILNRRPPANEAGDVLIFGIFVGTADAAVGLMSDGADQTDGCVVGRVVAAATGAAGGSALLAVVTGPGRVARHAYSSSPATTAAAAAAPRPQQRRPRVAGGPVQAVPGYRCRSSAAASRRRAASASVSRGCFGVSVLGFTLVRTPF